MFYIEDVAALELHGPFLTRSNAHAYAWLRGVTAYRIMTDRAAQNSHYIDNGSFRLVPIAHR